MEKHQLSPDVVDKIPTEVATISFTSGVSVNLGNELKPRQVKDQPKVEWNAQAGKFYTLIFTDPDNAPNRHAPTDPNVREWHHWLVGNIPGTNVDAGDTLTAYIGSGPPQGTGLHRYVYLVFQQTGKINFDEPTISNTSAVGRDKFSTRKFATKYNLGNPVAGNLYQAQWDDYVPTLYKQLGA